MIATPSFANTTIYHEGLLYKEQFKDIEGNNIKVTIEKTGNELVTKTFVNNDLLDSATREILANGTLKDTIYYVNYSQKDDTQQYKTSILNVNDYLDTFTTDKKINFNSEKELLDDVSSFTNSPSYPYLQSEYSDAWGYWGFLYGANTDNYEEEKSFQFDEDTAISIIISVLVGASIIIFTNGFTILALVTTLGSAIISGVITNAITGSVYQTIERWDYEVFVESTLSLVARIDYVYTEIFNRNGYLTNDYDNIRTYGPYENEFEMIHYGIYSYAI